MCEGAIENKTEKKCFRQTLNIVDKSIDKGNEIIEKLIKRLSHNKNINHENLKK